MSEFLVIAGLSGAGRSTAADTFEDFGWFVIDNMPPTLLTKVAELVASGGSEAERVALVLGRAGSERFDEELLPAIEELKGKRNRVTTLFLDASSETLIRRFEGTRRRHPVAGESVVEAIETERLMMQPIRDYADLVVDTTELNVHELRSRLVDVFDREKSNSSMQIQFMSFGFKHGIPLDADMVVDVRFLPNPHWQDELRPLSGLDEAVRKYVLEQDEASEFIVHLDRMLSFLIPLYEKEGKSYLTIAIGCTGGRHRSVVLTEILAEHSGSSGGLPVI
ncbi:MAG TPA: RNase adapter RapZ, partial [Acidimicrobiales bacterium]|nr:RNase adapter RapZ [Acidimicrobiales bacterium]